MLLGFFALFNLTDLLSTSIALRIGLEEANLMLLGVASALGVNVIVIMAALKAVFIFAMIVFGLIGIRSKNEKVRNMVFYFILGFILLFIYVSLNNIALIMRSS